MYTTLALMLLQVAFDSSTANIPMRDGVHLHTRIFVPAEQKAPLPIIMFRTPYGIDQGQFMFKNYFKELADEGYIFVLQDIRGGSSPRASSSCCGRRVTRATRKPSTRVRIPTTRSTGS